MTKIGIVAVLAAATWGCGSGGGYVCDTNSGGLHVCETISDPGSDLSALTAACSAEGGTAPSACSTSGVIGTCTITQDGVTETLTYYAGGSATATTAQAACAAQSGNWKGG